VATISRKLVKLLTPRTSLEVLFDNPVESSPLLDLFRRHAYRIPIRLMGPIRTTCRRRGPQLNSAAHRPLGRDAFTGTVSGNGTVTLINVCLKFRVVKLSSPPKRSQLFLRFIEIHAICIGWLQRDVTRKQGEFFTNERSRNRKLPVQRRQLRNRWRTPSYSCVSLLAVRKDERQLCSHDALRG
jgi:hypothetical protein